MAVEVSSPPRIGYDPALRRVSRDQGGDDLDWWRLGRILWRRKLFLLGFVVLVLGLTAAVVSRIPPAYEAEAMVMLDERRVQVGEIPDVLPTVPQGEDGVQSQTLLIESRNMAERLVNELNLHLLPEFNPALRADRTSLSEWLDPVRLMPTAVLDRLPTAWADTLMTATSPVEMTDQQQAALLRAEIIDNVLASIRAEPAERAPALRLKFVSTDPELAALGANKLAELYLAEQLETKQYASTQAGAFLQEEIERLRSSVEAAEQAIQAYREEHGIIEERPVDAQQLSELTTQLVISRSERAEAEARLRQVEQLLASDTSLQAAAQMVDSTVLAELRGREIDLAQQIQELSADYGERHPRMVSLRNELESLQGRKEEEIRQIARRLRDEVQVLRSREATLQSNIERLRKDLGEVNRAQIELKALEREAEAERELLTTYINRFKELASQQKAQQPDARIIADAVAPEEPKYPQRALIFGVAFLGSLLMGSLVVFGLESLDNTFRSSEQIEDLIGLPALGLVPAITDLSRGERPEDYVLDYPNSPFGEAVRSLRTAVLLTGGGAAPRTVLVTSAIPNEGKTSIAICLARINARAGRKTLMIDCDVRRPRLHELTDGGNQAGLSDVLLRGRDLDDVLVADDRSGAFFLTSGPPVPDPAAILASDKMRQLLKTASERYDLVILDSPPVLSVSDARVISQVADKTLFLVHWGSTRRQDVMMGVKQLMESGADMAGLVISRVNVKKHAAYGYRDSGYYYDDKYTKYYDVG